MNTKEQIKKDNFKILLHTVLNESNKRKWKRNKRK